MRIISQTGDDIPYERCVLTIFGEFVYAAHIYNLENKFVVASYSTQEKAEKAMRLLHEAYTGAPLIIKNIEVPEDLAEQLKDLRSGFITVLDREDNVRIEPMNIVFRFPTEDEIITDRKK